MSTSRASAAVIWRRAQIGAREKALARATLPIRVAQTLAYAVAILVALWIAFEFSQSPAWMQSLELKHLFLMDRAWSSALTGTTLLGIAAMLVSVALSSWYMLREE